SSFSPLEEATDAVSLGATPLDPPLSNVCVNSQSLCLVSSGGWDDDLCLLTSAILSSSGRTGGGGGAADLDSDSCLLPYCTVVRSRDADSRRD
ncbi:hypothetical protein PMAYCL1PPCAC_06042, partial [Pristionchus mayeri]